MMAKRCTSLSSWVSFLVVVGYDMQHHATGFSLLPRPLAADSRPSVMDPVTINDMFIGIRQRSSHRAIALPAKKDDASDELIPYSDFPQEERIGDADFRSLSSSGSSKNSNSVDWDAEWKKVVQNPQQYTSKDRTKRYYKSDAEIAAIKAANKATRQVNKAAAKVASNIPTWKSVKGDWKFWIGVLVILSVGVSLLSAPPMLPTGMETGAGSASQSYYI